MTIVQTIVFFTLTWWMVFYITLPFGYKKEDNPIVGQAPSAPKKTHLKTKIWVTTGVTFIITLIFWYLAS